jgi:WD40 repeat protein
MTRVAECPRLTHSSLLRLSCVFTTLGTGSGRPFCRCELQIWDVRGGKLVTDLCAPTRYEITGLEFSPTEYLLATSARDKVVRFWDLETFSNAEQTTPEATPVRNIAFHTDGKYIFSAVQVRIRQTGKRS